jgi:hypothetical protein
VTDFIDVLESQLVAAHPRAARRMLLPRPTWRRGAMVLAAAAAAAAIVAVVVALANPDAHRAGGQPTAPPPTTPAQTTTVAPAEPSVKVAVLNGTTVVSLAGKAAQKLEDYGFTPDVVANYRPPGRVRTTIYFADGSYADATAVAQCLGIDRIVQLPAHVAAQSGGDKVVLVIGADRAR